MQNIADKRRIDIRRIGFVTPGMGKQTRDR